MRYLKLYKIFESKSWEDRLIERNINTLISELSDIKEPNMVNLSISIFHNKSKNSFEFDYGDYTWTSKKDTFYDFPPQYNYYLSVGGDWTISDNSIDYKGLSRKIYTLIEKFFNSKLYGAKDCLMYWLPTVLKESKLNISKDEVMERIIEFDMIDKEFNVDMIAVNKFYDYYDIDVHVYGHSIKLLQTVLDKNNISYI